MRIQYDYTLENFDVVQKSILKDYNSNSTRTLGNGDMVPAYEVYRVHKIFGFRKRALVPQVRFETTQEVIDYLKIETGETVILT